MYLQPRANVQWFNAGVIALAALALIGIVGLKPLARLWFPPLLAVHFALGVWMIHASPTPAIDVVVVHREAIDAMSNGRSPYAINFENIYSPESGFYNPEAVAGNRVMFGYPYPPLNLLAAAPARWIAGDYRYAQLTVWIIAAALVGFMGPGMISKLAAVLLLMQPRGFFVLEQGWTEPLAMCMLALTLFAMARVPALAAWAGRLLTSETMPWSSLFRCWRFAAGVSAAGPSCARLSWVRSSRCRVIWSRAFIERVAAVREPVRLDSLSVLSWAVQHGFGAGSFLWAAAAAVGVALTMLVATRRQDSLCHSRCRHSWLLHLTKAFCNYYLFVAGAICCSPASNALLANQKAGHAQAAACGAANHA